MATDDDDNPQQPAPDPAAHSHTHPNTTPSTSTIESDPQPTPSTSSDSQVPVISLPTASEPNARQVDRTDLLLRARSFLTSPQIQPQDISAKRRFLQEKGLSGPEIDGLLRELPVQVPLVPPRSYPQPPPSNLPNLLLGLFRIFSWLAGGSAALMFIYNRFLLPRFILSFQARHSLVSHYKSLLQNLTTSLSALKVSQAESFSALPRPQLHKEDSKYSECHTIHEALAVSGASGDQTTEAQPRAGDIPPFSLLRCALEEFANEKASMEPSTEELSQALETQIPWLATEDAARYQNSLWQTLTTCPLFQHTESEPTATAIAAYRWSYHPPAPPSPSPLLSSLSSLSSSLPSPPSSQETTAYQHTLQSLADFTGYLTTQVYTFPFRTPGSHLSPAEEELRREIRALKGLVLNRRSFMPAMPGAASASPLHRVQD